MAESVYRSPTIAKRKPKPAVEEIVPVISEESITVEAPVVVEETKTEPFTAKLPPKSKMDQLYEVAAEVWK